MPRHAFQLTEAQASYIEAMITSGRYVDGSDFVRDLIRQEMASSVTGGDARTVTPRQIKTQSGRSVLQAVAAVERESEQYGKSGLDEDGISASRLGDMDVQQAVLHDRSEPTVLHIHHMPALVFIPKSMPVKVDPDVESIGLSRLATAPGGVYQIVGATSRVHPLTKHGKVIGALVAYKDARGVLQARGHSLRLVGGF